MATSFWKAAATALAPVFKPTSNLIPGITPGDWASPQQPIRVSQQLGVGVRSWDFTPGINLQFTPRGDVPISFGQLWRVSNSFDLCRLMIETRKDQVVNRPWAFRVQPKPGETKKDLQARNASDPDVAFLTELWKRPDGVHRFDIWARMLLEQLCVFDAPCVYPVRNILGDVIAPQMGVPGGFRLISGATITPLVDEQGFRPMPPAPAYQQIILGIPTGNLAAANPGGQTKGKEFTSDQLIYAPRNPRVDSRWGFSPVEQIIVTLSIAANRQQFLRDYYTSGNVPEGLLPMPETWTMQQIKDFQTWFDSMLAGNLARKRRMIMIPATEKGAQFSKDKALTDGTDDYLVRVVAYAFSITPQNLIKQVNRGTAKESTDVAQIEGLEPYLKHIENIVNDCTQVVRPGTTAEFAYQDEREMDPLKQAQTDKIYLDSGTYTRNEIREARGDDPRPEKAANELTVTTPTGVASIDAPPPDPAGGGGGEHDDPNAPPSGGRSTPVKLRKGQLRLVAGDLTPKSRQARQEATRLLARFLADQGKRVAKQAAAALAKAQKLRKDDDLDTATDRALAILALLNWDYPTLMRALQPYLEIAAEQGAQQGAYQVAANAGASLNDTLTAATATAKKAAADRAAEMVGLKVQDDGTIAEATGAHWDISTTASDDVLNSIKQAIKEGWKPEQLEAVIQAATVFSEDHAELTADQEISTQQANGHLASWSASGAVLEVQWMCMDLGCCAVCRSLNMLGSVPVGHEFMPLLFCPPQHPACRCWLVATKLKSEE
jgi:Phage portal protein